MGVEDLGIVMCHWWEYRPTQPFSRPTNSAPGFVSQRISHMYRGLFVVAGSSIALELDEWNILDVHHREDRSKSQDRNIVIGLDLQNIMLRKKEIEWNI